MAQGKEPEQRRGGRKGARRTDMELTFPDGLTRRPRVRGRSRGLGIVKRDGWPLCPSRLSGADQGLDEGDQLGRERGVRMLLRGQLTTGVQGQATGSFRSPPNLVVGSEKDPLPNLHKQETGYLDRGRVAEEATTPRALLPARPNRADKPKPIVPTSSATRKAPPSGQ